MENKVRKDRNMRKSYSLKEIYKFVFLYSSNNFLFNNSIRDNLSKEALSSNSLFFLHQCVTRCVNTGRRKRTSKLFGFSRLELSRLMRTKRILYWRKSKW